MTYCTYPGCFEDAYEFGMCPRHLLRVGMDPRATEFLRQGRLLADKSLLKEYKAFVAPMARKRQQYEHQSRRCRVCGVVCVGLSHLRTHWAAQHQETP